MSSFHQSFDYPPTPLHSLFYFRCRRAFFPLPEPTLIAQRFPISLPHPPDYQSPASRVETVPFSPLYRRLTTSTYPFVSPIYCHIRSLSLCCAARARQSVSTRLPISSTSLPVCRLPSASRCHPVFCRDLRIILILVCCLYAVLPYISHSLVAPLICCRAPGIARGRLL